MKSRFSLSFLFLMFGCSAVVAVAQESGSTNEPPTEATSASQPTTEDSADPQLQESPVVNEEEESSISDTTTVIDLEALINLPASARLRREADENPDKPRSLFDSTEIRSAYLGITPRYVYIPRGVDPMIIPWIRERIVVGELLEDTQSEFDALRRETNPEIALATARKVLRKTESIATDYPNTNRLPDVQKLSDEVRVFIDQLTKPVDNVVDDNTEIKAPKVTVVLPIWVRENTRGIIYDRENIDNSVVLVGDFIVTEGQQIERYPTVTVKDIQDRRVIYEFQQTEHVVIVESN